MNGFSIIFDNDHDGTYVANCIVTFESVSAASKSPMTCRVPGGQVNGLHGIPDDATKLGIEIKFEGGDDFHHRYATPKTQLPKGWVKFEIHGVWPLGAHVTCITT